MSLRAFLAAGGYVETERVRRVLPYHGSDLALMTKRFVLPSLMQQPPVLSRAHESIGWVDTWPVMTGAELRNWFDRDPYDPFMFAGGDGDDEEYYIANAIRKVWSWALGGGEETLELARSGFEFPHPAERFVIDGEIKRFPIGTFGFGGAMPVTHLDATSLGALSVLDQQDDPIGAYMVTRYVLSAVGQQIGMDADLVSEFDELRHDLLAEEAVPVASS